VPAEPVARAAPAPTPPPARRRGWLEALAERPEVAVEIPARRLRAQSRRDFVLFAAGFAASAVGAWWLLPDRTRARLLPGAANDRLDTLAARVGLSRANRERVLDRALTFDDDVAEALYSKGRRVRTYSRSQVTPLRNNYNGDTPGPEYLPGWTLAMAGLASGRTERFTIEDLMGRFPHVEQVTRLVCVEGWSAVAWWGGIRFADVLAAFPPAPGARWAAMRSAVNLDGAGRSDPYYVSIDLETARHPQTLLATHLGGAPLTVEHGAPLRLLVPMKLGLKNIKAVTDIAYVIDEPDDYWNERGYSKYDGL
jgi:DMSO/TMAO reductase YedYZ molybdopterin-dependent catalytic subunit